MITSRHSFVRRHFIGAAVIVVVFLCGLLLWQFPGAILTAGADLWAVSDRVDGPADAIIVLGGQFGPRPRTLAAADLYRRGIAPKVLVSNPNPSAAAESERSDAVANREILRKLGVPDSAISIFGSGLRNTHDEARAVLEWAKDTHAKRIIVPVEWYFSRRARWTFQHELAEAGVEVQIQRLDSIEPTQADWWRRKEGVVVLQDEFLKYVYYRLKY